MAIARASKKKTARRRREVHVPMMYKMTRH
jgi:hypothetical protein